MEKRSCCMPSRKPGKFPNGKAAGTSGGLCQLSTVSGCPLGGRDGFPCGDPLRRWSLWISCNRRNRIDGENRFGDVFPNVRQRRCRGEPQARPSRPPVFLSALFKGGGPLRLRNGGGLAALWAAFPFRSICTEQMVSFGFSVKPSWEIHRSSQFMDGPVSHCTLINFISYYSFA